MENQTAFQVQYRDHQRQMAWVNTEGWQFDPPKTRKQGRETVAHRAAEGAARADDSVLHMATSTAITAVMLHQRK